MKNPLCYILGHDKKLSIDEDRLGCDTYSECQRVGCDYTENEYEADMAMKIMVGTGVSVINELESEANSDGEDT